VHVTPTELRAVTRGALVLRYAALGPIAGVLVELPANGTLETTLEEPCTEPHWGVVLRGEIEIEEGGRRRVVPAGSGYHVRGGGAGHRFHAARRAILAGFVPLEGRDLEEALAPLAVDVGEDPGPAEERAIPTPAGAPPAEGEIRAEATEMGPWLLTAAEFGPKSGYGTGYCDASHWGVVLAGGAGVEFEDDVEVLGAGDFYYMPPGPPGHRIEVADRAVTADFTPRSEVDGSVRLAEWRKEIRTPSPGGMP
jgi:hypothetical protein